MPDVNILVYAHRRDETTHERYRAWLEEVVAGPAPFALSALVAVAFLRIVTHRRIYSDPTPPAVAVGVIDTLLGAPTCRLVAPGARHWVLVRQLSLASAATGKLVADAQHAAVALEHGCEWVTRDDDFARFESQGLRWRLLQAE